MRWDCFYVWQLQMGDLRMRNCFPSSRHWRDVSGSQGFLFR